MLDTELRNFWNWFAKNSGKLHSDAYDSELLDELDMTISSWGFGWEIGPGLIKGNSLTISPNGDRQLLSKAFKIIESAPILEDWEFYSSKQPKTNWDKAELGSIKIDAANWTYILLKYPDGQNEIIIQAENLKQFDTSTKELAVDLILTNLLGEKRKIEELDFVDIVDEHEGKRAITQLRFLPDRISKAKNGT